MIPISKDQKLEYEHDGVKYFFHPPIGDLEMQLQKHLNDSDDKLKQVKGIYPEVVKTLEAEYKGKRKPKKAEWEKLLQKRVLKLMDERGVSEDDLDAGIEKSKGIIDLILCGWESNKDIPKFPKEKPSQFLTIPLMQHLSTWYWGEYTVTIDELKK